MFNNQNYGCLMASIDPKMGKNIVKFGKTMVPEKHLYINSEQDISGYETEPHITIKYGLVNDLTDEHIKQIIGGMNKFINEGMNDIIWSNPGRKWKW